MPLALALLSGALIVASLVPTLLWRLHRTRVDPLLLIAAWALSIVGVLGTVVAAVALLVLEGHGASGSLIRAVHGCWAAISHGGPPQLQQIAGILGSAILLALAARLALIGWRQTTQRRHAREQRLRLLRLAGHSDTGRPPTLWLEHSRPLAFSLAGPRPLVVATLGLTQRLTEREVLAVLEHERAHVRGHHHLLLAAAHALAGALPVLPLLRQAPTALTDLVELAADAAASRRCGARVLHDALAKVSSFDLPPAALAIGNHAVDLRLRRLADAAPARPLGERAVGVGLVGAASVVAPAAAATAVFTTVAAVLCALF